MAEITGTTVYVLGAGASCHTGAPLLADFLVSARALTGGKYREDLENKESFENVFKWIDTLRAASYYVEFDLDNLEHIFSLAEMQKQIGSEEGEKLCQSLKHVIVETLDRNIGGTNDGRYIIPDATYHHFANSLSDLNNQRQERIHQTDDIFEKDAIITFNYDIMLDYAFGARICDYCIDEIPSPDKFKILKLHGSINWGVCSHCKSRPIQTVATRPITEGYDHKHTPKIGGKSRFVRIIYTLKDHKCEKCGRKHVLEPYIIPPTWSKKIESPQLERVWKTAVNEISKACQLIVIGYSMPPTDTFLQYLLTLGLANNPNLHRVLVVNKDDSDNFKQRYRRVFSRSLFDRGRLEFITGDDATFRNFIDRMKEVGICFS